MCLNLKRRCICYERSIKDYDKYYTNTTLTRVYTKLNDLNSHPDKKNNYINECRHW
jgi:hypothetical protein